MYKTFNETMERNRILLWNASDPLIQPRIAKYSYTAEKLQEGQALWEQTDNYDKQQDKKLGDQKMATIQLNETWQQAISDLKQLKELARLVFETKPNVWDLLKLNKPDTTRFEDWLPDAVSVYTNLLDNQEWITAMQSLGYSSESLTAQKEKVASLKGLQKIQLREMGDAQQATENKWKTYEILNNWCNTLREIARIEFEDDPQLLEKLGILAPSNA